MARLDLIAATRKKYRTDELFRFVTVAFGFTWAFWWASAWISHVSESFPTLPITLLGGFGPALAAVILTKRASQDEWRDFARRSFRGWGLPWRWWSVILGVGFVPMLVAKLVPIGGSEILMVGLSGIGAVVVGGIIPSFGEELGWRGYALDRLQARWSPVKASLLLGVIWATWHIPLFFVEGWWYAEVGLPLAPIFLVWLLAFSVLLTAAYNLSQRSILVAVLMHAASNMAWALFAPTLGEFSVATAIFLAMAVITASTVLRNRRAAPTSAAEVGHLAVR